MTRRAFTIILMVGMLLSAAPRLVSAKDYYFKHYDRSNGLPHQTVYCAMQDSRGFMWFGTKAGLSRFDGQNFKNFTFTGSGDGLGSNIVNALAEAPDGVLWFGTQQGLGSYDPVRDRFEPYESQNLPPGFSVSGLCFDRQGKLWIISAKGILCIDPKSGEEWPYDASGNFIPNGLTVTSSGRVWISGSDGCVHLFEAEKGELHRYQILARDEISRHINLHGISECGGEIIIATNSDGARALSPNTGEVRTLFRKDADGDPIFIHTLLRVRNDEFWFGCESGIHIYRMESGFCDRITKMYDREYSLSDNAVHALFRDRDGGIWAGTFFGGVNYMAGGNPLFDKYLPTDAAGRVHANVIRQIQPAPDGNLWVGTEDGGLCLLDVAAGTLTIRDDIRWNGRALSRNIQALVLDGDDLWIGTFDDGAYVLDLKTGRLKAHVGTDATPSEQSAPLTVTMFRTSSGEILLGTQEGLFVYDASRRRFVPVRSMDGRFIHAIYEDSQRRLWVGTFGQGLYRTEGASFSRDCGFEKLDFAPSTITSVTEGVRGKIWICTEGFGLYQYDPASGACDKVISERDYPGIIVYQVVGDAMGDNWISTSYGLFQYNGHKGIVNHYTEENGLLTDQFNYNSSYQSREGRIYFGSLRGLVAFSPENAQYHRNDRLKVYFTGMWVNGRESGQSLLFSDHVSLNHDQSVFSLQFAAPYFSASGNVWYRYRLDGVDSDWNLSYGPKRLEYTKLPPGKYVLRICASEDYNTWVGEESRLTINVRPAPLASKTARFIYLLVLLSLAVTILLSVRKRNETRRLAHLEKMNDEKQKEILQAKIGFFTNITHEIRTPLTLILGALNRIRRTDEQRFDKDENLQLLSRNTRRLNELINQILDFRKIESTWFHLDFKRVDFNEVVSETFNNFRLGAEDRKIDYQIELPAGSCMVTADRDALIKIVGNMISNALKYCDSLVRVKLESDGDTVRLTVTNDGATIPENVREEIFKPFYQYRDNEHPEVGGTGLGLSLARSLAEMHNGKLVYDSSSPDLNAFVFSLAAEQEENEKTEPEAADTMPASAQDHREGHRHTILIVDDESDVRDFVGEELEDEYNILQAKDGSEALEMLDKHNVSLIISDLMMPNIDGISLCRKIKESIKYCHIPIIVLTAKVSMQAHIDALDSKADAFIEKPFSTEHLKAQIASLLANREIMRSTIINSPYAHLSSMASNSIDRKMIEKMNTYIMENLSSPDLSVESLADQMNMSISTLYRKVRSTTSLSPNEFIRLCKLKKAAELLSGGLRVNEVATQLGFSKPSYFSNCFMKQFGMTPQEFIRMSKRNSDIPQSD